MPYATVADPLPVLVVDDDSALIRTLADILRLHGYAPATAETGREGLRQAEATSPALAIVDLRLPDMDGMELAAKLHALSDLTEVVVLTGNASVESAVAALREHSVDYLLKPVQIDKLLHVATIATERWQRRHAEEKMRQSDERFRRVVQSDMLGINFWNAEGGLDDANDAFLQLSGYSRAELEAGEITMARLTPSEYADRDRKKWAEAKNGVLRAYEKEMIRKDGVRIPVLVGASVLEGPKSGGVAFVLDITQRKAAERAVLSRARQQAAVASFGQRALGAEDMPALLEDGAQLVAETLDMPFSSILERKSDGSALILRAGVGWGSSAIGQLLVTLGEEKQQAGFTFAHAEPAIVSDFSTEQRFAASKLARDHGIASGVTVVIPGPTHPYGVLGAHDTRAREFTQDHVHFLQAIAHIIGTAVERHRTERAFRQAQRLEAVGRLASGVAHDFNNMLTAITGYGEIVRSTLAEDDSRTGDVDEILKAAGRAAGLTRQLLAFSRQQVLQPRVVMLNEIVLGIEKMLTRLIGENIEFRTVLHDDLGLVKADPGQLEQVILNLCVNARDAMPNGGTLTIDTANVELDVTQSREFSMDAPGSYVMLSVTDTGIGMDADTKARIFEPFFTTKAPDKGTGLGLATVYGIVKQSGGELWVYSELGRGTTFKVFLPQLTDYSSTEERVQPKPSTVNGSETILLAEDEDAIRRVAQRVLEKMGYRVLAAKDGAEAKSLSRDYEGHIHLLVTDMMMPMLNGRELAAGLRGQRPDLHVLFLSGYTDDAMAQQGLLDAGAHFLQKPFAVDTLARKVREILDDSARSGGR